MTNNVEVRDENVYSKPVYIFGKDVREIKCFRMSIICGIWSGVIGGLGCFLLTSKAKLSINAAFGFLWLGAFSYWIPCRYKYETSLYVMEAVKARQLKIKNPPQNNSEEKAS